MKGSGRSQAATTIADQDQHLCDTMSGSLPRMLLRPSRLCRSGRSHEDDWCLSQNMATTWMVLVDSLPGSVSGAGIVALLYDVRSELVFVPSCVGCCVMPLIDDVNTT